MTTRPHDGDVFATVTSALPVGDEGNITVLLNDAEAARFKVVSVNGLTVKVYAQAQPGGAWVVHESWQAAPGGPTYTKRAANTTITLAAADEIYVTAPGMYAVRLTRQAGTTADIVGRAFDGISAWLLERALLSGIAVTDGGGSLTVDNNGTFVVQNNGTGKTIKTYSASITADTDVIAAVTAKRIKVFAYSIITTDNTGDTVIFKSNGTTGTELWRVYLKGPDANTPFGANIAVSPPGFLFATVAGEKLTADVSSAATLHLCIAYWDDDAS